MTFKIGFIWIVLRVIILALFFVGLIYTYYQTDFVVTPIMFGLCSIVSVIELLFFLNRRERHWSQFLLSVQHHDFNRAYKNQTKSKELQNAYELITESFEKLQTDRVADYRLLQTVLGHISIGLICYSPTGEVYFVNKSFNEILNKPDLHQLQAMLKDEPAIHEALLDESVTSAVIPHQNQKLYLKKESFKLKGKDYRLVSLADIQNPLETNELESYQKLMRVMTHEIMNSATPILSLIQVINKKLVANQTLKTLELKDQSNVATSLGVIEEQTGNMLKFVESYRQINKPIQLSPSSFEVTELVEQVVAFVQPPGQVKIAINAPERINLHADKSLLSQVLINLLKNALEALEEKQSGEVDISLQSVNQILQITVSDSGPGVAAEERDKIFVPFYTTKKEGSGIGLALSRKILKAHGGRISYTRKGEMSEFRIELPTH